VREAASAAGRLVPLLAIALPSPEPPRSRARTGHPAPTQWRCVAASATRRRFCELGEEIILIVPPCRSISFSKSSVRRFLRMAKPTTTSPPRRTAPPRRSRSTVGRRFHSPVAGSFVFESGGAACSLRPAGPPRRFFEPCPGRGAAGNRKEPGRRSGLRAATAARCQESRCQGRCESQLTQPTCGPFLAVEELLHLSPHPPPADLWIQSARFPLEGWGPEARSIEPGSAAGSRPFRLRVRAPASGPSIAPRTNFAVWQFFETVRPPAPQPAPARKPTQAPFSDDDQERQAAQ